LIEWGLYSFERKTTNIGKNHLYRQSPEDAKNGVRKKKFTPINLDMEGWGGV